VLLYYITDRRQFAGDATGQRQRLLAKISEAARCGVDYIQLREKDLATPELESLATDAAQAVAHGPSTKLLISTRCDIALASGAAGVHLPAGEIGAEVARLIFRQAGRQDAVIAVSCHSAEAAAQVESKGADFAVFAPVFEKSGERVSQGLAAFRAAREALRHMPLLALGGVTLENARACMDAGAAGIAAIRLFQENDIARVIAALRKA
jgi:thiamine-phosphate pyrophosphorylase